MMIESKKTASRSAAKKAATVLAAFAALSVCAFAQESYSGVYPEISTEMTFSSGIKNIDENATVDEIPGLSSEYTADIGIQIKGSFSRASEWGVEKEDGIQWKSGVGYEAGFTVDMSKVYEAVNASDSSSSSSSTSNHYSRIQPMINWYEANMSKYGLPYDPCGTGTGMWPSTSYGGSSSRYQFIIGSTVEPASDVNWTSQKWADAQALYNEIYYHIKTAIDQLDYSLLATGDVSYASYQDMSSSEKEKAELKMKAKREFEAIVDGDSDSTDLKDAVKEAYITITNIAGAADARVDFMGKRLLAGDKIFSHLAGQSEGGSALTVSLKKGLVQGLEASVFTGIAGGEEQVAEDYDTDTLDYWPGIDGEWAAGAKARYTFYAESLGATIQAQVQGIASDMLVAKKNFALDAGLSYSAKGFVGYGAYIEAMLLNWKDRTDDNADYDFSKSVAAGADVSFFGATLSAAGSWKSAFFEHKVWSSTDRFYGYSAASDYYIANTEQAAKAQASLSFNPQYFTGYDFVTLSGGVEAFLYGDDLDVNGKGFFGKLELDAEDFTTIPLTVYGGFNYYKNSELIEWSDYSTLPDQDFADFTKFSAGAVFAPVKYLELSAEYASSPSYSRRNSERISSFTVNGKIKFD